MADPVVDSIKQRLDIADLVGQTVQLKKAGRLLKGLCPFHQEKTPSFVVYPDEGRYHCFGCGKSGDVFTWVQETQHLDFGETLRLLASRTGVTLPERTQRQPEPAVVASSDALAAAAQWFHDQLLRSPEAETARSYLVHRGLKRETVEHFGIGWAPDRRDALLSHLHEKGLAPEHLEAAGLIVRGESGTHDRFRGRVMFPIRDPEGKVRGFGGRTLGDGQPKYLNSPQTEFFDKGAMLYGLDLARPFIRKEGHAVIVEGYMDVVAPHQAGFGNVVASLGTSLTEQQVALLRRYTSTIILALDADAAGQAATLRGLEVARQALAERSRPVPGRVTRTGYLSTSTGQIKIATLLGGKDPDEIVRENPAAWQSMVANAIPMLDHKLNVELAKVDLHDSAGKAAAVAEMARFLVQVSDPIEESHYVDQIAQRLRLDMRAVQAEVGRAARALRLEERRKEQAARNAAAVGQAGSPDADRAEGRLPPAGEPSAVTAPRSSRQSDELGGVAGAVPETVAEEHLISLLLQAPRLLKRLPTRLTPEDFRQPQARELFRSLLGAVDSGGERRSQARNAAANGPEWPIGATEPVPRVTIAPSRSAGTSGLGSSDLSGDHVRSHVDESLRDYYDAVLRRARKGPPHTESQLEADLAGVARRIRERNLREQLREAQYLLLETAAEEERVALQRQVERLAAQLGRVQLERSRTALYTSSPA